MKRYHSKELLLLKKIYDKDQILFESATPGSYQLEILDNGTFEYTACGGGGGGGGSAAAHAWYGGTGGSAAAFSGFIVLKKGLYTINIGAGGPGGAPSGSNAYAGGNGENTSFLLNEINLINTGGGHGGNGTGGSYNDGAGGILSVHSSIEIISSKIQKNGVAASTVSILGNGFGSGGYAQVANWGTNGTGGYVKLIYKF